MPDKLVAKHADGLCLRFSSGVDRTANAVACGLPLNNRALRRRFGRCRICEREAAHDDAQFVEEDQREHHQQHAGWIGRCEHHRQEGDDEDRHASAFAIGVLIENINPLQEHHHQR